MAAPRTERTYPPLLRAMAILVGVALLLPVALATRAIDVLSVWGLVQWAATAMLVGGLLSLPFRAPRRVGPSRVAVAVLLLVSLVRVAIVGGSGGARLTTLPGDRSARFVDRLFEERDAAILGARLLLDVEDSVPAEFPSLPALLVDAYGRLDAEAPRLGSPVVATYLGWQRENAFDTFVIERADDATPSDAAGTVVFLHGYAGNFAMQCWEVASAAREAGLRTLCPSTGPDGTWSDREGEAIVQRTLEAVRAANDGPVVLAGLSNGAVGASRLAPSLRGEIHGLALISGADPDAGDPHVPVLLIQGDDDSMTRPALARGYRSAHRSRVRDYAELEGTHFVLLEQRDAVRARIAAFLATLVD